MQLLASEEYQSSKRVSVYLNMPTEVDTEPVLKVRQLKNAQNCPELTLSFTVGHFQQWEVSGWFFTFISQRSRLMNTIFSLSTKIVFCAPVQGSQHGHAEGALTGGLQFPSQDQVEHTTTRG